MMKTLINVIAIIIIFIAGAYTHSLGTFTNLNNTVEGIRSMVREKQVAKHHQTRYFFNLAIPNDLDMSHIVDVNGWEYHFTPDEFRSGALHVLVPSGKDTP